MCNSFVLSIFDGLELSYSITYYHTLHYIIIICTHACKIRSLESLPEPGRRLHGGPTETLQNLRAEARVSTSKLVN